MSQVLNIVTEGVGVIGVMLELLVVAVVVVVVVVVGVVVVLVVVVVVVVVLEAVVLLLVLVVVIGGLLSAEDKVGFVVKWTGLFIYFKKLFQS